ncbi:MAG TPA: hypothetical protein VN688_27380 [Gemmataceae bacterium]|nr:hypothetical protein [Gemmataceae bacterium]
MFFTVRNIVILALIQVGVIVAGVLGAGACHKWYTTFNLLPPLETRLVSEYGFVALLLPVVWAAIALRAVRCEDESANLRWYAGLGGVVLLFLLLVGAGYVGLQPLGRLLGNL